MAITLTLLVLLMQGCINAAPAVSESDKTDLIQERQEKEDLKADASTAYDRGYSNWAGGYPGSYNSLVTGYGLLDENKYQPYNSGINGYDYNYRGGYDRGYSGYNGYIGNSGYGGNKGYAGYDPTAVGGYSLGYGGYGGNGGNGGLTSYYGYNNPYYQGAYHLGYGYYNKKPGYGNIYNNGITPSLVTGYRGYSRR